MAKMADKEKTDKEKIQSYALLSRAVVEEDAATLGRLLAQGALAWAPAPGEAAKALLEEPRDPMVCAIVRGSAPFVDVLLAAGWRADAKPTDHQPMMVAAQSGSAQFVKAMARVGGDPNGGWDNGRSALAHCIDSKHSEKSRLDVVKALVKAGARVSSPRPSPKESPQWESPLARAIQRESPMIAQFLLEAGADPNQASREGRSPLHLAVDWNQPAIVAALLAHGAAIKNGRSVPDSAQETGAAVLPLMELAARRGAAQCAAILVEAGCDPTKKQVAAEARAAGNGEFAKLLTTELRAAWERKALSGTVGDARAAPASSKARL